MGQGIHKYTVQEAENIQLGQCRSAYSNDQDTYSPASGELVVAIQMIQDCKFTTITPEDPANCFGDSAVGLGNAGGTGDPVDAADLFPAGTVIYGRWTEVDLAQGIAILYMAR